MLLICTASHGKNLISARRVSELASERGLANEVVDLTEVDLPLYTSRSAEAPEGLPVLESKFSAATAEEIAPELHRPNRTITRRIITLPENPTPKPLARPSARRTRIPQPRSRSARGDHGWSVTQTAVEARQGSFERRRILAREPNSPLQNVPLRPKAAS